MLGLDGCMQDMIVVVGQRFVDGNGMFLHVLSTTGSFRDVEQSNQDTINTNYRDFILVIIVTVSSA